MKTTKDQIERKRMIIFKAVVSYPWNLQQRSKLNYKYWMELFISVDITNFYQKYLCHLVKVIGVKITTVHWGGILLSENVQKSYLLTP